MHTILGAGGPIANHLTRILLQHGHEVRLVSRRPVTKFVTAKWVKADLLNGEELKSAVQGSSVIYLCAGLRYNKITWKTEWPVIMDNVIAATKRTHARLIFFDNVYMYGKVDGPMTESTPYHPISVKGEIRARIATKLMDEAKAGYIKASIARSADFYGASVTNSFFDAMVLDKYAKRQKALWIGDPWKKHSLTYVQDAARAVYLLGQHPSSDNQVWHVPTAPALTGIELMRIAAATFQVKPGYTRVNKFMLLALGLFKREIAESAEMYYQYTYDYIFDSSRFEKAFDVKPTSYQEGLLELRNA